MAKYVGLKTGVSVQIQLSFQSFFLYGITQIANAPTIACLGMSVALESFWDEVVSQVGEICLVLIFYQVRSVSNSNFNVDRNVVKITLMHTW